MSKRKKIFVWIAASIGGLIVVLIVASILVLRSAWFANFVREKMVATIEESTGGSVQIGSFQFDWTHLTVRIRDFVLHGTEPPSDAPLVRVPLLEVHLKLLSGIYHAVDLEYVGIQHPQVNLIIFPDGKTNIPEPKVKQESSNSNGLETVVDLKIGKFDIENGYVQVAQQKTGFSGRGENLRLLMNYNAARPSYQGNLWIDPLLLAESNRPPLNVHVNLPITIEKDGVALANAKLTTEQSQIVLNASVRNMNAPVVNAGLNANLSLPEMQRSFELPIDSNAKGAPKLLAAQFAMHMDKNSIEIQTAHLALGDTTFQAVGTLRNRSHTGAVQFNANLALAQIGDLMKMTAQPSGAIQLNGNAKLDAQNNYIVNGTMNGRGLGVRSGTTRISDVALYSPFHADPYLISLDGLKLNALGGALNGKIFVEKMQLFSVEGSLRNFSLPVLAAVATGKHLGYDGTIDGSLNAKGDLKAKGTSSYTAFADLSIVPGRRGVPVSGRLDANYAGRTDTVSLDHSYLALPNSRLDISGSLNRRIDLRLVSQNLNDFLPAANFASTTPQKSLPITLQGGTASMQAQITGSVTAPHITGHLAMNRFAIEQRSFDRFALDVAASPSGAAIQNGLLTRKTLRTTFDASIGLRKWAPVPRSPLVADVTLRNGNVADLLSLAGESSIQASGNLSSDVHVHGTYGNPLGSATLQITNGNAYGQPIDRLFASVSFSDQLITLSPLEVASGPARIDVNGAFQHPRDSFTVGHAQFQVMTSNLQLANIQPLQRENAGIAGLIQLNAAGGANISRVNNQSQITISNITADFSARGLRVQNQDAGNMTATVRTVNGAVNYNLYSDFAGSNINVNGSTLLAKNYPTRATASVQNLSIRKTLLIAGQSSLPARGTLSANAHFAGTIQNPNADLSLTLAHANVYEEPINHLAGSFRYSNTLIDIPSLRLDVPAGSITLAGSFTHPASNFNAGALNLKLTSTDIHVAEIHHIEQLKPGTAGVLRLAADLSATLRDRNGSRSVLFSRLNADVAANRLRMNGRNLGDATFTASTAGSNVKFRLDSDIAQSQIQGAGQAVLTGDYPVRANLSFANVRYSNLAPFISSTPESQPSFDGLVEGQVSVDGPVLKTDQLNGRLELTHLDAHTIPGVSPTGAPPRRSIDFRNKGPIIIALNKQVLHVEQFRIAGPGTDIHASGGMDLKNASSPMRVNVGANLNLAVLEDIDREIYSSGEVTLDAAVHGNFSQPMVNGRLELKNANVNYEEAPNGISNANAVILLNGASANIESFTAQSGGGKVTLAGFVGYTGRALTYNLHAAADRVLTLYSSVSIVSSANISLTGNSNRSLLSGRVSIHKLAYESGTDAGSFLSSASTPPSTPTTPSGLLAGMRLDIQILTAPDLRVVSDYTQRLSIEANLTVRGTAADPGIIGRVTITDGQLVFFGNQYTVNVGTINFYNPNAIQPVLHVSLETIAQGVDVTITISGPIDNLKLSYRSDPPLTFEQIIELLATNKTPNTDPQIAAQQPAPPQQSFTQMGESAILGQAIANPLANRLQRVFGISQLKINPAIQGPNNQPTAQVTLQQQITQNLTFTYTTDLAQSNAEIIRIEWAFTPKFSALALRDYNGNVSIQFFYKFKVR